MVGRRPLHVLDGEHRLDVLVGQACERVALVRRDALDRRVGEQAAPESSADAACARGGREGGSACGRARRGGGRRECRLTDVGPEADQIAARDDERRNGRERLELPRAALAVLLGRAQGAEDVLGDVVVYGPLKEGRLGHEQLVKTPDAAVRERVGVVPAAHGRPWAGSAMQLVKDLGEKCESRRRTLQARPRVGGRGGRSVGSAAHWPR